MGARGQPDTIVKKRVKNPAEALVVVVVVVAVEVAVVTRGRPPKHIREMESEEIESAFVWNQRRQ